MVPTIYPKLAFDPLRDLTSISLVTEVPISLAVRAASPFRDLAGLIIEVSEFPGWDTLGALIAHFRFVRDHHRHIRKVAIVTNAPIGTLAEKMASHFVAATIKHFPAGQLDAARQWIKSPAAA